MNPAVGVRHRNPYKEYRQVRQQLPRRRKFCHICKNPILDRRSRWSRRQLCKVCWSLLVAKKRERKRLLKGVEAVSKVIVNDVRPAIVKQSYYKRYCHLCQSPIVSRINPLDGPAYCRSCFEQEDKRYDFEVEQGGPSMIRYRRRCAVCQKPVLSFKAPESGPTYCLKHFTDAVYPDRLQCYDIVECYNSMERPSFRKIARMMGRSTERISTLLESAGYVLRCPACQFVRPQGKKFLFCPQCKTVMRLHKDEPDG